MNISLPRLIEGMIATIRSDVVPHIGDAYARGQAVGVIDLLNNLASRVEWAYQPLVQQVEGRRALLDAVAGLVSDTEFCPAAPAVAQATTRELTEARRELDSAICDAIERLWVRRNEQGAGDALALIRRYLHDEMADEMKRTRKPLFAEIASGSGGEKD